MSVTPYATYFLVATAIGGKPQRQKVCIADHGSIHAAFIEAASFYADLYGLTREQRTELMSREPSKELFTETLHSRFVERKGVITGAFEKILMSIDH